MAEVPMGALDAAPYDENRELQEGLKYVLQDEAAKKASKRSWYDTANDVAHTPGRILGSLTASPGGPEADEQAMMPETFVSPLVKNTMDAVGGAVKSGVTAAHDIGTGEVPLWSPDNKSANPEAIGRVFDMASLGGGASIAGTAEKGASTLGRDYRVLGKKVGSGEPFPHQLVDHPVGAETPPWISYPMGNPGYDAGPRFDLAHRPKGAVDAAVDAQIGWHANDAGLTPVSKTLPRPWETGSTLASDTAKPGFAVAAAEHAPPFYSGLEKAVAEHPHEVAPASQWAGALKNKPGVKPDEMKYTNTDQLLAQRGQEPLTKQELLDHLEKNKVQIGEVEKTGAFDKMPPDEQHILIDNYADRHEMRPNHVDTTDPHFLDYVADNSPLGTKYHDYQLPGGSNYREKLLTLPSHAVNDVAVRDWHDLSPKVWREATNAEKNIMRNEYMRANGSRPDYKSSHWDEPNVLAHLRMNDRDVSGNGFVVRNQVSGHASQNFPDQASAQAYIDSLPANLQRRVNTVPARDTKPSLHLEELQSDWHQAGRKKGYGPGGELSLKPDWRITTLENGEQAVFGPGKTTPYAISQTPEAAMDAAARFGGVNRAPAGVPDAPFKKNWHELGLKRALHEAAETGKDRISWTPGEAQAARYDLSKHYKELRLTHNKDGAGELQMQPAHGTSTSIQIKSKDDLVNAVGKDLADKLYEQGYRNNGKAMLQGLDLKVGGEGMKGFYDKMVPDYLNKIGKPHGVQVKEGTTSAGRPIANTPDGFWARPAAEREAWLEKNTNHQPVHYMDIPPSLKQQLLTKGMPLFEDSSPGMGVAAAKHLGASEHGGLSFPAEEAADRLRMKLAREQKSADKGTELAGAPANARTVIQAPPGSNLPDFVAGKITPQDWIARHEHILSPEEIKKSAGWYDEIYGEFLKHTGGDEALAKKYMRAWLVSQQNIDVSGAMANTLLQREQINRGVPEAQMKAGGMPNPTQAARNVLKDEPVTGVGQKISDFVDAAEGKNVRSWMGNQPEGGKPFVVDVHTARDTGMVDEELKNHLTRLGYNKDAIAKLKEDLGTSPSQTQYENRAKFGQDLTDHLNKIKWQGRDDWTPKEVQAVGWMGMTKLTANKADNVATGLQNNMRHLSMELAPGEGSPWAAKYGERFNALPPERQRALTHEMTQDAIKRASDITGVDVRHITHGTGGWQTYQNPSSVAQTFASKSGAEAAANVLGHLLQQTEVWSNKVKSPTANPKGFAVDLMASGDHGIGTDAGLRDLWTKVMAAEPVKKSPLFQGYQPIRGPDGRQGIRILIDKGGAGTQKALEEALHPVKAMLESEPGQYELTRHEAEIYKARNDWKEHPNGEGYRQRLVEALGSNRAALVDHHGAALESKFRKALETEEKRAATGRMKKEGGQQ